MDSPTRESVLVVEQAAELVCIRHDARNGLAAGLVEAGANGSARAPVYTGVNTHLLAPRLYRLVPTLRAFCRRLSRV